jgi:hypothetical protein
MTEQRLSDPAPIPEGFRVTWEIGKAELQKSVMAVETFEALRDGTTNVDAIRTLIRRKRKLIVHPSSGRCTETPSNRFINEHAWALAIMSDTERQEQKNLCDMGCFARLPFDR